MEYTFRFYEDKDYEEIEKLILASYKWEYPSFGLARFSFSHGLHPKFCKLHKAWERTCGVYIENDKIVACALNEGNDCGDTFFFFDSKERAQDEELLEDMITFAKTVMSTVEEREGERVRFSRIMIPEWNEVLRKLVESRDYEKEDFTEKVMLKNFDVKEYEVKLPEGYTIEDGTSTPAFYRANVHMACFEYSIKEGFQRNEAFEELRKEKNYDASFDLVVLDKMKRPVAMAIIWMHPDMPYCELEPLGVAWWERRKGLATAILNEAANRVCEKYPHCQGMTGGDQKFYKAIGFEEKSRTTAYKWQTTIYPSWDERSEERDYSKEV